MLEENNLKILIPNGPTNIGHNKKTKPSTLDYFIVSEDVEVSNLEILDRDKLSENSSTHFPITAEFHIKSENKGTKEDNINPEKESKLDSQSEIFVRR